MSLLTLVRHGQASFGAADYDRLSEVGHEQSKRLAEHWISQGIAFNDVITGPRKRQQDTAHAIGACFAARSLPWPHVRVDPDFDEFDLSGIFRQLAPSLASASAEFHAALSNYERSKGAPDEQRGFQRMFELLMQHWIGMRHDAGMAIEDWPAFCARVQRALDRIRSHPARGRRVAVVTSGGVIGTVMRLSLGTPDAMALELSYRLRNASLTEIIYSQDRWTVDAFNATPHLSDPALWTFR